jgi:hypothetical protein
VCKPPERPLGGQSGTARRSRERPRHVASSRNLTCGPYDQDDADFRLPSDYGRCKLELHRSHPQLGA